MRALVMAAAQPAPELISLPGLGHVEDETLARRYQCPPRQLLQELLESGCSLTSVHGGTPDLSAAIPCAWEWVGEIEITDREVTRSGEFSMVFSHEGPPECVVRPPSVTRRALERISERRWNWKYSTLDAHKLSDAASRHYSGLLHKQQRDNECLDEMFRQHLRQNKDKLGTGQALAASLAAVAPSLELTAVPIALRIALRMASGSSLPSAEDGVPDGAH